MLCPNHKLPVNVFNNLRRDLGLPDDFIKSLQPEYPGYFQIVEGGGCKGGFYLELICYSKDLAVLEMKRRINRWVKIGCWKLRRPVLEAPDSMLMAPQLAKNGRLGWQFSLTWCSGAFSISD